MGQKCGIGDGEGARGETKFVLKAFNLMQVIANKKLKAQTVMKWNQELSNIGDDTLNIHYTTHKLTLKIKKLNSGKRLCDFPTPLNISIT